MNQYKKLVEKFKQRPESIRLSELQKILIRNWFNLRKAKSSHYIYNKWEIIFTIPIHNNDCKPIYKKKVKDTLFN